jgi:hypothetical protein
MLKSPSSTLAIVSACAGFALHGGTEDIFSELSSSKEAGPGLSRYVDADAGRL